MAEKRIPDPGTEPGISITREFDAPRERIWREWTTAEAFADWYGGTEAEIPLETVEMDVREGGQWRATMFFGSGRREIPWEGKYLEVVEPERLVFTVTDQPDGDEYALCTVVLTDLGDDRTKMVFEQRDWMSDAQHKAAGAGWGKFFDRMTARLDES